MGSDTDRTTVLPNQLWPDELLTSLSEAGIKGRKDESQPIPPKNVEINKPSRSRKPDKETKSTALRSLKRPPTKYHKTYVVDQAGPAVIALKDTEKLPICLLKSYSPTKLQSAPSLQFVTHKNLLSLIDHFKSEDELFLVYEYEHFAISLGCVAGTVQFSEADMATICREILEGLKYIHSVLKMPYSLLNLSNILLTWQGEVKLANIGESLLRQESDGSMKQDIQDVGSVVVYLSDRNASLQEPGFDKDQPYLSNLASSFVQKTKVKMNVEVLMRDEFLNLANPGGAWSLKRHYFETLPFGIHIGSRAI